VRVGRQFAGSASHVFITWLRIQRERGVVHHLVVERELISKGILSGSLVHNIVHKIVYYLVDLHL